MSRCIAQCLHFIKHLLCPFENGPGVQIDALIEQAPLSVGSPVLDGRNVGTAEARRIKAQKGYKLQTCVHTEVSVLPVVGLVS